jgi:hypothetical protein
MITRGEYRILLSCEVKKKEENYTVFYFADFFYIFMKSLLHRKKKNAPLIAAGAAMVFISNLNGN